MKPWYSSKLVWIGLATAVVGASDSVLGAGLLSKESAEWVLIVSGAATAILRIWGTDTAIGKPPAPDQEEE